jgi:hypothetical protein
MASIMPFFNEFPAEAQIVGRLLTGYGELELELAKCVGTATGKIDDTINAIFSKRGAEHRIKLAGKLAERGYDAVGLGDVYRTTVKDMDHCRSIRNQYAHCLWYPLCKDGLGFINLEDVARNAVPLWPLESHRHLVDLRLLQHQEEFFHTVQLWFWYVTGEYDVRVNDKKGHIWVRPSTLPRPALHN